MKTLTNQAKNMANKSSSSISKMKQQTQSYKKGIEDTKLSLKELKNEAGKMELKGIDPYAVLSVRDSFRLLGAQAIETLPIIADIGQALKDNLDGKYGDSLLMKFKELGAVNTFKHLASEITNTMPIVRSFKQALQDNLNGKYGDSLLMKIRDIGVKTVETANKIKSSLGNAFNNVKENVSQKISPVTSFIKNFGTVAKNTFIEVKENIKESANTSGTPINKLKKLIDSIKNIGKESDKSKKKTNGFGDKLGKTFNKGLTSIKKFALGLLSVRTAFSMVSKAMQSYLSYDTELSDSIQNCWNVLGSLLAPALEFLVSLFSKAVSYVNAFVQALTGINLVARANTKALNKQASASKNANKQLSGIDDLNNLTTGGDDNKPIMVEPVDIGKLDFLFDWIDKVKELMLTIFDPIKKAWDNKGKVFLDSIKNSFLGIKNIGESVFGSILEVWTNGTGQKQIENKLQIFTNIFNIVGKLGDVLSNAWNNAGNGTSIIQSIADIFIDIQEIVISISDSLLKWTMSENFQNAINVVVSVISDLFDYCKQISDWVVEMYETYLAPVIDKLLDCISKIVIAIGAVWDFLKPIIDQVIQTIMNVLEPAIKGICGFIGGIIDAISGVMDFITGVFTGDWDKAWSGIKEFLGGIIDAISSLFNGLFETIGAVFKGAWDNIVAIWNVVSGWFNDNVIKPIGDFFSNVWTKIKNGAKEAWDGIKNVFSSVATFFKDIFSKAWTGVKNVFSTGGKIFDGIKDGIVTAFKTVVNAIIVGINKVVSLPFKGLNNILNKIQTLSIVGIKPFNWISWRAPIPQIPSLAGGGVLEEETLVRVAEYSNAKSNPEIISPRDMMKETFRDVLEETDFSGTRIDRLTLKVLDETVYDGAIDYINEKSRIKGVSVIKGV